MKNGNIHDCEISVQDEILSLALDIHFTVENCCGCLILRNSLDDTNGKWIQTFICKQCGNAIIINYNEETNQDQKVR